MIIQMSSLARQQHRLIHDIYVLLDDGDRQVLELLGLSPLEFSVLQQLDIEQGQRLTDVGAKLLCVKSTITRIVDRLERERLVIRLPDPEDRRAQRLVLTQRGEEVRNQALHLHNDSVERRLGRLSARELQELNQLLAKLRSGLEEDLDVQKGEHQA